MTNTSLIETVLEYQLLPPGSRAFGVVMYSIASVCPVRIVTFEGSDLETSFRYALQVHLQNI